MDARRAALRLAFGCLAFGCLALGLGACEGDPLTGRSTKLEGCPEVPPPDSCADAPTYTLTVRPILAKSCVPCHYGSLEPDALWALTDYGDVAAWNDLIKTNLLKCAQPPADSVFPFSEADREAILKWTRCNHPK
jgi:hypothetical protein